MNSLYSCRHGICLLQSYTPEEIVARNEQYYKFIFVRHPITRIYSAFLNKFVKDTTTSFIKEIGPKIIRHAGRRLSRRGPEHYHISFTEFLSYLLSKGQSLRQEEYFQKISPLCSPCAIKYDFIGKQETFNEDSNYLLNHIFNKSISSAEVLFPAHSGKPVTVEAFLKVPEFIKKEAMAEYAEDNEMFGYDMQGYL